MLCPPMIVSVFAPFVRSVCQALASGYFGPPWPGLAKLRFADNTVPT